MKATRAKQVVLQAKVAQFNDEGVENKVVEKVAEVFEERFACNQGLIDGELDKQRNRLMARVISRKCASFSRTMRSFDRGE